LEGVVNRFEVEIEKVRDLRAEDSGKAKADLEKMQFEVQFYKQELEKYMRSTGVQKSVKMP